MTKILNSKNKLLYYSNLIDHLMFIHYFIYRLANYQFLKYNLYLQLLELYSSLT